MLAKDKFVLNGNDTQILLKVVIDICGTWLKACSQTKHTSKNF